MKSFGDMQMVRDFDEVSVAAFTRRCNKRYRFRDKEGEIKDIVELVLQMNKADRIFFHG